MDQLELHTAQLQTLLSNLNQVTQLTQQVDPPRFYNINNVDELRELCSHHNGFIREKALIILGLRNIQQALPEIINRLNDWSPQVRKAARQSLTLLLKNIQEIDFIINYLPQLYQLLNCGRDDHQSSINNVVTMLLQPEYRADITNALWHNQPEVARIVLQLVITYQLLSLSEIYQHCLTHTDTIIRLTTARLMLSEPDSVTRQDVLTALSDNFAPIRVLAIEYLMLYPHDVIKQTEVESLFFDHNTRIRLWAIKQLQHHFQQSPDYLLAIYQRVLSSPNQPAKKLSYALWAIGIISPINAVTINQPFLAHTSSLVRRSALQTYVRVSAVIEKIVLFSALQDRSAKVTKEAAQLFIKQQLGLSVAELKQLVLQTRHLHQIKACYQLVQCLNKWDRLIFSLEQISVAPTDESLRLLSCWNSQFNHSGTQPEIQQIRQINVLLDSLSSQTNSFNINILNEVMMFFTPWLVR